LAIRWNNGFGEILIWRNHSKVTRVITDILYKNILVRLKLGDFVTIRQFTKFSSSPIFVLIRYNFQIAQITERLHAIWDYMKKVKSSISMVPPIHYFPLNIFTLGSLSKGQRGQNVAIFIRILCVCVEVHMLCILIFWWQTSCNSRKLDQTPLICSTSPSS